MIELMITVLLISVGVAGYVQSIVLSSMTAESNKRMAIAAQRGRVIMESIKSTDFEDGVRDVQCESC